MIQMVLIDLAIDLVSIDLTILGMRRGRWRWRGIANAIRWLTSS